MILRTFMRRAINSGITTGIKVVNKKRQKTPQPVVNQPVVNQPVVKQTAQQGRDENALSNAEKQEIQRAKKERRLKNQQKREERQRKQENKASS